MAMEDDAASPNASASEPSTPDARMTTAAETNPEKSALALALSGAPSVKKDVEELMEAFVQKHKRADLPALKMAELKEQHDKLKNEKRKVQKEIKNEVRKRQRLKSKAKKFTADELVQVSALRAQGENKQSQKVKDTDKKKSSSSKVAERMVYFSCYTLHGFCVLPHVDRCCC